MRLESIRLRQWRVFEDETIEFPSGLIGIRGSNGSGKTTIAEAVGWALFGKLRDRAKVGGLKRDGAPDGERSSVELVFRLGDVRYRVERVVSGPAKLWIGEGREPETTATRATNARIAHELDLTWDMFCRTVFARQKDVAALDPGAATDDRRKHVERLLGLSRLRDAAGKAKAERTRLAAELDGLRESAPDLGGLEGELRDAEARAGEDDPSAQVAVEALGRAKERAALAAQAVTDEELRAQRHGALEARLRERERALSEAKQRRAAADSECGHRRGDIARLEAIKDDAEGAAAAGESAEEWSRLAKAEADVAAALAAIDDSGFDAGAAAARAAELEAAQTELNALVVPDAPDRVERRLAALKEVARAGDVAAARSVLAEAESALGEATKAHAELSAAADAEREHLRLLRETDDPNCPVCLRPLEGDTAELEAAHERRLAEILSNSEVAVGAKTVASQALSSARAAAQAADLAAGRLAETSGPDVIDEAERALADGQAARAGALERHATLTVEVDRLGPLVKADRDAAGEHQRLAAELERSRKEAAVARARLGVESFDSAAYAAATAEAPRLKRLRDEAVELRGRIAGSAGCDERLGRATSDVDDAQKAVNEAADEITKLAYDASAITALQRTVSEAEQKKADAERELLAARTAAATASGQVTQLRSRVEEARRAATAIRDRETDVRAHKLVEDILGEYRDAQSARAWPTLEESASEYLAQATDGRYADIRISPEDFRFVIVDRGEEHGFERFSGGEQDLANLCVRLAIADWIARERGVEMGLVVLDEVFGSQDDDRRKLLMDRLRRLSERFQQLIVITHVPDIAELCEHELVVTLEEPGRSRAEFS